FFTMPLWSQTDTNALNIQHRLKRIETELTNNPITKKNYEDLTFYYGQMMKNRSDSASTHSGLKLSGYIDAYSAHYSDEIPLGEFQKFPTAAPISNTFGLNMAMISAQYQAENIVGTVTLHTGDIPRSAWSLQYNAIQEAHVGLKLMSKLWLESGFFRTHLGFESIQPRENIGSTIALTSYFEPYFLSGAKLTYYASDKLHVQTSVFNGFNTFIAVNDRKTYGLSVGYDANKHLSISFNSLYSDMSTMGDALRKKRLYNDIYLTYKSNRLDVGAEANWGIQSHSLLADSNKTASMYSFTIATKYKFLGGKYAVYARGEVFNDDNEILTGPIQNSYHQWVGINATGLNLGVEYKAMANSFLRFEGRHITLKNYEDIFFTNGNFSSQRWEWVASMGVWF
ncbi:MAG: outer membrane beta-barrel protein, partial [Bacteroidota bacterium]